MVHVAEPDQRLVERDTAVEIDTLRVVAFTMLVSYHVVGPEPGSGLDIAYPHGLRIYADYLIHLRMPIFAVIAGYVYGLRPLRLPRFPGFVLGKVRRLLIPGAVAALLFAAASTAMNNGFARTWSDLWMVLVYPYAHYWYLQTMMVIFVGAGLADAALRGRFTIWLFLAACVASLSSLSVQVNFFSLRLVPYLLPFFLFGLVLCRHRAAVHRIRWPLIALCLAVIAYVSLLQHRSLMETGALLIDRRAPMALAFGLAACCLLFLAMPRLAAIDWLAPFAFTVYLYHVFGTAGTREVLEALGVTGLTPLFVLGVTGGIALPVALHLLADRWSISRRLMLGKRA